MQGASPGDGLQLFSTTDPVLTLDMVNRIFLDSLTITGGSRGILAVGAHVSATNVNVEGQALYNIQATRSSSVNLIDSTVQDSGFDGISALSSSAVVLRNTGVFDSFRDGLSAYHGGSITLVGSTNVSDSGRFGGATGNSGSIVVSQGAVVQLSGSHGIFVDTGGSVRVGSPFGAGFVQNNTGWGLFVATGGSAEVIFPGSRVGDNRNGGILVGAGKLRIANGALVESNGFPINGPGVRATVGGTVFITTNSIIEGNAGNGIHVNDKSLAFGFSGNNQIINNGAWGIFCDTHPDALARLWGNIGTVSGNPSGNTNCLGNFFIVP